MDLIKIKYGTHGSMIDTQHTLKLEYKYTHEDELVTIKMTKVCLDDLIALGQKQGLNISLGE